MDSAPQADADGRGAGGRRHRRAGRRTGAARIDRGSGCAAGDEPRGCRGHAVIAGRAADGDCVEGVPRVDISGDRGPARVSAEYSENAFVPRAQRAPSSPGAPGDDDHVRETIMTDRFLCHDKESLIAYLYGEAEPPLRQQIDEHLRSCLDCTEELASLSEVRVSLSSWTPPHPELGITIARNSEAAPHASWWSDVPAWAQLAAAVLVLAVGAGVANIQVRSTSDGWALTTGWMAPSSVAPAAVTVDEAWKPALAALESRLRGEIQTNGSHAIAPVSSPARGSEDATLRQVQTMLAASEQRQRQELALRLTQLTRDLDVQRRADLVRISQGFGQFEGRTGEMMARQRQLMNYITRVSGQPQQ